MGRPKNIFYGGRVSAIVRCHSRSIVATFPSLLPIIEAALYAKSCQYLYLNATTAGVSLTTQVIGEILIKSGAASVASGHELCSHCVLRLHCARR